MTETKSHLHFFNEGKSSGKITNKDFKIKENLEKVNHKLGTKNDTKKS